MPVSSVNAGQAGAAYYPKKSAEPESQQKEKEPAVPASKSQDSYTPSAQFTVDTEKVAAMKADLDHQVSAFQKMVAALIQKQGNAGGMHDELLKIDEATQLAAQEAISDDGYWGVEQTSKRILDFAKALSGGDPSKIGMLRDAFLEGFKEAEKAWGGTLPEISQKTYDRVMQGFEDWEKSFGPQEE